MKVPREVIKQAAQMRIDSVLAALGVNERLRGSYVVVCNPARGEKNPSLQIWTKPGYEGAFKDHGAAEDYKGDVFQLVALYRGWWDEPHRGFEKAADWLTELLGLGSIDPARSRELAATAQAQKKIREDEQRYEDVSNARKAKAMWLGFKTAPGAAHVFYFASRGIDLTKLAAPPHALRYSMQHRHRESGKGFPVIAACMTDKSGEICAVHRTFLAYDGRDHIGRALDIKPARKIWPSYEGCIIPLARGASGLRVKEACAQGIADDLVLTEGVEDGLSFAVSDHSVRVWAVGSLSNLAHVPVPPCASSILVSVDNDWSKPQAKKQLGKGLDHLHTFGVPVIEMRAAIGKDANDLLKGARQ